MKEKKPNILLITVDQMRYPRFNYQSGGMLDPIKEILGFQPTSDDNPYLHIFPGFNKLRNNAVVLRNHHIASSACVPSRATIYTGQYGTRTHVMETDSLFKYGSDPNFPWLHPRGIPTIGDWFRAAGYDTHYYGKWDLSFADVEGPMKGDLNPWGFSDWKVSAPDAQGGTLNELGVYRDPGYADFVSTFLRRKGMNYVDAPNEPQPWLCVASFVNPHDIASAYPISWWMPEFLEQQGTPGVQTESNDLDPSTPRPIPVKGDLSNPIPGGRMRVPLNPRGIQQDIFSNPPNLHEPLKNKPTCQFDYSYKMGLALKSRRPPDQRDYQTLPFQLLDNSDAWFAAYGQFYAYCHTLVDKQIHRVLGALEESGLRDETIVVFLSDHGDYGGAHGGLVEKWHTAYEEILHVPMLISNPKINCHENKVRYVDQLTSHIDVLPTLLGLAGFDAKAQNFIGKGMTDHTYIPLPGADLSAVIDDPKTPVKGPDGKIRESVLFITDDTITDHLKGEPPSTAFKIFEGEVAAQQKNGIPLADGSVAQPNHIRCIRTKNWKLARYWDPSGGETDQWELYNLADDPTEIHNLVSWDDQGQAVAEPGRIPPGWNLTPDQLSDQLARLQTQLAQLESDYLTPVAPKERQFSFGN